MKNLVLPVLLAADLLAGCASFPGGSSSLEPAFCVASITGRGGVLTQSLSAEPPRNPAGLRSLRGIRGGASTEGCDVMLEVSEGVMETGAGSSEHLRNTGTHADCSITAYSAATHKELWKGIATSPGCWVLEQTLRRDFQPGTPYFRALEPARGAPSDPLAPPAKGGAEKI